MKKNQNLKILMTIIITAIITFSVTLLWMYGNKEETFSSTNIGTALKSDKLSTKLKLIKSKIDNEYIGDVDENKLIEWAVKGYVEGLGDIYSDYFTPEEMQEYTQDTLGEYVGIGVYITRDTNANKILISGTIKNSPAEQAELKAGDILTAVDGIPCTGDDFDHITDKIKGKMGTKVKIKVLRNNEEKEFEIERKNVEIIRVTSQMLDNNIGYIYISSFDGTKVAEQFEEEYNNLKRQGATSLIVDLRNNGGGIVDEATDIGDLFTDKGTTLLIEEDKNGKESVIKAKRDKEITMNTVLLVNKYSASASEILAGIIKDETENVTIIGDTTYGKGVIQSLYTLSDGSGLKITTNQYFTPKHNEINKKGIEPDIKIESYDFDGEIDKDKDTEIKKAMELLKNR